MTRTAKILALLTSLVALAVTAPTASASAEVKAIDPAGIRHGSLDPAGIRHGSITPNPFRTKANQPQRRHLR